MFSNLSMIDIWILVSFVVFTIVADIVLGLVGARWGGAHWTSILWGIVGLIVSGFILPVPVLGSLVGMFAAILISEWLRTKDADKAQKAALGGFLGWLAGMGFKLVAFFVFIILFIVLAIV